jgi:hypothetical protein
MQTPKNIQVEESTVSDALIQAPATPVYFANICNTILTPEDARLVFGVRELVKPGETESVVTVFTTIYAVKRLSEALNELLGRYEGDFGPIEVDFTKRLISSVAPVLIEEDDEKERAL